MLKITTIQYKMKIGMNNPMRVQCSDSEQYVMKCINRSTNGKALFNELIAARFANIIGVPTPGFTIGTLDQSIINKNENLLDYEFKPGKCFLSKFVSGTAFGINPILARQMKNIDVVPNLIFFDAILMNSDRATNRGNWFFTRGSNLIALDHTNIFKIAQIWDKYSLMQAEKIPPLIIEQLHDESYSILANEYKNRKNNIHHPFSSLVRKLSKMSSIEVNEIFTKIPTEWDITNDDLNAAKEFLSFQLTHIKDLARELENLFRF
ncbi:hypothetical protein LMB54_01215 [Limosilactobacillus reuteri]|uniref:HipA family kinase n=1 Tax=Limosilactobacillus reuteri TaxID=1598 RepID=UPI001E3997A1|nr:HipA family kinase [Limosilactobacillus reuteri]MCC4382426.1 hypothetical protein [Limosilactobacillus reuteri]MCC4420545.1 hypothetical protein [Limosilactobacillus reuteri]